MRIGLVVVILTLLVPSVVRAQLPAPELEPNVGWLNTDRPLRFDDDLKGHVVLLDFWTYCCINCLHVLPDLEYLEAKYADAPFIVIGVHSAKFESEGERDAVRNAMRRYDIKHPVVVDQNMSIWRQYGVRAWPSFALIGADGIVIGTAAGEGLRELLDEAIGEALRQGREAGTLADERISYELDAETPAPTGMRYPGKVHAVAPDPSREDRPGYVFVAESSQDRVIVAAWPDSEGASRVIDVFGGGERGLEDGGPEVSRFHDPQGMVYDASRHTLFVADTKNHAVRAIDLTTREVRTLVGNGVQSYDREGGAAGAAQGLASPWALELSADGRTLYVAMAGTHQLWSVDIASGEAKAIAGGRGEDIVDAPALDALLAQPSGLALSADGKRLFFADSEVSGIRFMELDERRIQTIIGTGLFDFGDIDGVHPAARLQHALGVTRWPLSDAAGEDAESERYLIADTYNDKIKLLEPHAYRVQTWLGGSAMGAVAGGLELDEPGGLHLAMDATGNATLFIADTNHHRVVVVDPATETWQPMRISGLRAPGVDVEAVERIETTVAATAGEALTLTLAPTLPDGARPNAEMPVTAVVRKSDGTKLAQRTLRTDALPFEIEVPAAGVRTGGVLLVDLGFAYCFDDAGVCVPAQAAWRVTLGDAGEPRLTAEID